MKDNRKKIEEAARKWEAEILNPRVKRFNLDKSPTSFHTPLSSDNSHFLDKVGFPGQYPFTAGNNPFDFWNAHAQTAAKLGYRPDWGGVRRGR